jgi:hypothetical protein
MCHSRAGSESTHLTSPPYRFALSIAPTAHRQPTDLLPGAVAAGAYEFIVGPLLDNPHQVGKRLPAPLADGTVLVVAPTG